MSIVLITVNFIKIISQFTRITSIEQRRRYKTEFDKDYGEYMRLHADTEPITRRFAQLDDQLKSAKHNDQRYKVRNRDGYHQNPLEIWIPNEFKLNNIFKIFLKIKRKFNMKMCILYRKSNSKFSRSSRSRWRITHSTKRKRNGMSNFSELNQWQTVWLPHWSMHLSI